MTHYWPECMPRRLEYVPATVGEVLPAAVAMYGDRVAVADGEETLSYRELANAAASVAEDFQRHGVGQGDVVALHLPNCLEFLVAYYGTMLAGASVTLVNPLQPPDPLLHQLEAVGAVAVVTHPDHADALCKLGGSRFRRVLLARGTDCAPEPEDEDAARRVLAWDHAARLTDVTVAGGRPPAAPTTTPQDVAHFAFTGGTSGAPKGVRVLHRNVVGNATQMLAWRLSSQVTRAQDGLLHVSRIPGLEEPFVVPGQAVSVHVPPLFHAHALISSVAAVLSGMTIVLIGRFRPARYVELANRWQATYVTGNPTMFMALAAHCRETGEAVPSMRLAISGAAPLDQEKVDRIAAVFPNARFGEGYGLTEGTCMVTASPVTPGSLMKIGTVGIPVADTEIELRDVDGVTPVPHGEEGELWVRGPQVTDGYHEAPEITAGQYVDGWLRTGDIGVRDEDGFIRIRDRAKDMLIYNGYNVYPRELEGVLAGHPAVARAAVVGRPSTEAGEFPVAFVVPEQGAAVDPDELMAWTTERVLPYQRIREVYVVDDLPTSSAGKVLKNEIRLLLQG